ncbi:MAG: substrate-binding domain-containing protein [Clostridiales bacterium]|nr:substrate-binding domain-containing protein [Clostridiales bacterium]
MKKYYILTSLMTLILSPAAASIGLFGAILVPTGILQFIAPVLMVILVWALHSRAAKLPDKASQVFLPAFIASCYYMGAWIAVFGLSSYRFDSSLFEGLYFGLTAPYFVINVLLSFGGDFSFFPLITAGTAVVTVLTVVITCAICKKKITFDKKVLVYALITICLFGIAAIQQFSRSMAVLSSDYQIERIKDEVNLYEYRPFSSSDKVASKLMRLDEPPTISFAENYPKLDGATAAYPVYAAIVQELYKGLDEKTVEQFVTCSKTDEAYQRLIDGKIDVFFGAQPSKQQVQAAKEKGVELSLTPIAREAFVFFVNKDNSVSSLTLEQIQSIYQKKITNWRDVGGKAGKIMPFQRPENSGSQTVMLAMVMGGKSLPEPLWEEYAAGMGGVISQVAEYRNYSAAIGYSFRFFATGMKPDENIKLLAIDGIDPTAENIQNGTYPLAIDVYAVTAGSDNENTDKLIEWILSEQGQNFIEKCGYVRIAKRTRL